MTFKKDFDDILGFILNPHQKEVLVDHDNPWKEKEIPVIAKEPPVDISGLAYTHNGQVYPGKIGVHIGVVLAFGLMLLLPLVAFFS